ncbi:hypothetical protein CPB85DRAFT_1272362 [Mucidula mucida]|nr:hypothetical protein CPB85DRAFT_1272362 [Mucidula mucida]
MNTISAQAIEEASNIATEFIYSIDNLPNEIRQMCEEIKHLDSKAYDIQAAIEGECQRYVEASRQATGVPPNYKAPTQARISAAFAEVQRLTHEKMILSSSMISLITRTQARLDGDLAKVRRLQGETPPPPIQTRSSPSASTGFTLGSNAATQISENLRSVMSPVAAPSPTPQRRSPSVAAVPTATTPSGSATKKRKITAAPSIKLPPARSISPIPPPKSTPVPRQSRLSRQLHPAPPPPAPVPVPEPKVEAEADVEAEEEEADDDKPYCFCQKKSFGDMIACDGTNCPYEWFHYECVGLKSGQLKETTNWYCPACLPKIATQTSARRRRR